LLTEGKWAQGKDRRQRLLLLVAPRRLAYNSCMLGDSVALADGLWLVEGEEPGADHRFPDVPNVLLYRCNSRLTLIDSGVGPAMRQALAGLLDEAAPAGSFTLLNTHGHADHVANNDLIREAPAPTQSKRHYLSRPGLELLDADTYLARQYHILSDYYDPLAGFAGQPWKFRLAATARDLLSPLIGVERAYRWLMPLSRHRFHPYEPSRATIRFFEDLPQETITIGGRNWEGWVLPEEGVWVLPDRAHSPDHVLFYLPDQRLLHTGDLTFDIFNAWPDSDSDRIREMIGRVIELVAAGAVTVLTDSHHRQVLRGEEPITFFLKRLLADDLKFRQVLASIVRANPGATVPQLYRHLKERRDTEKVVDHYLGLEYPQTRSTMQAVILLTLLDMGCRCEGVTRQNRFFLPPRR